MQCPEEVLDGVVIPDEEGFIELLVKVADEVLSTDGRDFEGKTF